MLSSEFGFRKDVKKFFCSGRESIILFSTFIFFLFFDLCVFVVFFSLFMFFKILVILMNSFWWLTAWWGPIGSSFFFWSGKLLFLLLRRETEATTKKGDVRPGNVTQPCESHTQRVSVGSPALKTGNSKIPGVKFKSGARREKNSWKLSRMSNSLLKKKKYQARP